MAGSLGIGRSSAYTYSNVGGNEARVSIKAGATSSETSSSSSLTNLTTKSDALGRVIPRTWGHVVVGGALVWASPFYVITESIKKTTQYYAEIENPGDLTNENLQNVIDAHGATTKVTLSTSTDYGIDLCYSVGFDGGQGLRREVYRVKLNGTLVYDGLDGYVMPGIGFDIREHTDLDIPLAMQEYKLTGKYFYPGQTLITFSQFRTKMWGGAVPVAVEVEFVTEGALGQSGYRPVVGDYGNYNDLFRGWGFVDFDRRRQYFFVQDIKDGTLRPGVRVFNVDTGAHLGDIPFTGGVDKNSFNQFYNQMAFCPKLNVLVTNAAPFGGDGYHAGYIDFNDGKAQTGIIGGNSQSGFVCISDDGTTAEVLTSSIFNGLSCITLKRVNGVIQASYGPSDQSSSNGVGWWDHATGWGEGAAIVDVGYVWLVTKGAKLLRCERPAELDAIAPGYSPAYVLAHKGAAISVWGAPGADPYIVAYNSDGTFRAKRTFSPGVVTIFNNTMPYSGPPSDRFFGCLYFTDLQYIDLVTLITVAYPGPRDGPGGNNFDMGYDKLTNQCVNAQQHPDGTFYGGFIGPELKTGKILLMEFIRSLYVGAGMYSAGQITWAGDIFDEITGAVLVNDVDVNGLVDQLCDLYRLAKNVTNAGVYFYKTRSASTAVIVNETINIADLALEQDQQDNATPIRSQRNSDDTTPAAITLKFIDEGNEYKENSVTWRRVQALNAQGQDAQLALPIVMKADEALYLVQQAVVDVEASTFTHEFRLPWRYACYLEPNDIIAIIDGPYRTVVQIDEMDVNGDLSASCRATSIGSVNISDITPPAIIPPSVPIDTNVVEARGYVFDTPLLTYRDEPEAGQYLTYWGIGPSREGTFNGGYFGRKLIDGEYTSLPTVLNRNSVAAYACTTALGDVRWTLDPASVSVTRISGVAPPTRTIPELMAGPLVNLAWYGAPGRWEIVRVLKVSGGKATGFLRGLRGTEIHAGKHVPGDLLVFVADAIVHEARPLDLVGATELWRPVAVGKGFGSTGDMAPIVVQGNSAREFAPAAVSGQRGEPGGPVTLAWLRRNRRASAWGALPLPVPDPLAFRVRVLADDGTTVVREWNVSAETATYSAEDQATDGNAAATSLKVSVAQIGATGPGFSEVVTINGL